MDITAQQVREEIPLGVGITLGANEELPPGATEVQPLKEPSEPKQRRRRPRKRTRNPPITTRDRVRWTILRLDEMTYEAIARKDDHDYCAATVKRAVHKFSESLSIRLPEWRKPMWRHGTNKRRRKRA